MNAPLAEKHPPFKLPQIVWMIWIVGAGILAFINRDQLNGSYGFGYFIGSIIGLALFPTVIAWMVWRLSRRSQRAAGIAFTLILALLVASQFSQADERGKHRVSLDQFAENLEHEKAELKAQIEQGEDVTQEQLENLTSQTQESLSQLADSSKGQDRDVALGMKEFLARGQALQKKHGQAIAALQLETFLDLNGHENAELRAQKMADIEEWRVANLALRDFVANASTSISKALESRQVSWVNIRDVLAGYRKSTATTNVAILAIRDLDNDLIEALIEFIAFAEKYEDQWFLDPDTGELQLPTDEAVEVYTILVARISEIGEKQITLQRQVLTGQM